MDNENVTEPVEAQPEVTEDPTPIETEVLDTPEASEDIEDVEPDVPELVTIELGGKAFQVDPELQEAFMLKADYTRKTQEVAENRKAVEAEQTAYQQSQKAEREIGDDVTKMRMMDAELGQFRDLDWNELQQTDPNLFQQLQVRYMTLRDEREVLGHNVAGKARDLELKAQQAHAERIERTRQTIAAQNPGWDEAKANELRTFAIGLGFDMADVDRSMNSDPNAVKVLNLAMLGQQVLTQRQKPKQTSGSSESKAEPLPTKLKGKGVPASGPTDRQSTDDWMKARNKQLKRSA